MGRTNFTATEIEQLRLLVREKQTADGSRQKTLRARMRRIGFYISDFADYSGFTASDFDDLLKRGVITCSPGSAEAGQLDTTTASSVARPVHRPTVEIRVSGALAWYDELRERYRPTTLRVLMIGESPPDPGAGDRRFFYSPRLTYDNLYRGVAEAVFGGRPDVDLRDKPRVLELLRADGFWLIDAVEHPIDKASPSTRRKAIRDGTQALVERCQELAPARGVVICHGLVYGLTAEPLRRAGVRVLHNAPLPFPLGNWRTQFVEGFRAALRQ